MCQQFVTQYSDANEIRRKADVEKTPVTRAMLLTGVDINIQRLI
jgi:hypothetical protein